MLQQDPSTADVALEPTQQRTRRLGQALKQGRPARRHLKRSRRKSVRHFRRSGSTRKKSAFPIEWRCYSGPVTLWLLRISFNLCGRQYRNPRCSTAPARNQVKLKGPPRLCSRAKHRHKLKTRAEGRNQGHRDTIQSRRLGGNIPDAVRRAKVAAGHNQPGHLQSCSQWVGRGSPTHGPGRFRQGASASEPQGGMPKCCMFATCLTFPL